jgi:hypothetical protein
MKIEDFTRGWFIGDFEPSLFNTQEFEVGVKKYTKGDKEKAHYHILSKEFTIVISGFIKMNNILYKENDIVTVNENEISDFECIEDATLVVVRTKSNKKDKYIV